METIDEIMKRKLKEAQSEVQSAERDLEQAIAKGREKIAKAQGKVELLSDLCTLAWDGYAERQQAYKASLKRRN